MCRQMPRLAIMVRKVNPPSKAVQEIDEAGARWNMERSVRRMPPLSGSAGAPIAVHAQPDLPTARLRAVGSGEGFEDGDSVNRRGWYDPLVGPTVVVGFLFENGPGYHDQFGCLTRIACHPRLHTANLQVHDLADPWTNQVRNHHEACCVEHVQKLRKIAS